MKDFFEVSKICFLILFIFVSGSLFAQQEMKNDTILVKGVIVKADNQLPIIGAAVREKGNASGTITDSLGRFELKKKRGSALTISYIGMSVLEISISDSYCRKVSLNIDGIKKSLPEKTAQRLLMFTCTNHNPSHSAINLKEMEKLSNTHHCLFQ